jgi:hypothetical protein
MVERQSASLQTRGSIPPTRSTVVEELLDRHFSKQDVKVFCWFPRTLLTMEVAWMRTVYGRQRRVDGAWEYYNYPWGCKPL